ncbi:MAG TPA: ATP-binding protein [Vicinamibacterales bacterium]|jgi:hypothetical protein|nr:ATP-binding protein [Vicinamibacterales bacterium]
MGSGSRTGRDRALFDQSPQPMWAFDEETLRVVDVNHAALALYGYSRQEFLQMGVIDVHPDDLSRLLDDIDGEPDEAAEPCTWTHRRKDGTDIDVEVAANRAVLDGRPARVIAVRDVSGLREREERLRQTEKIETVGRLAGSIAHDFNNLLTAIMGHTDLLSEYFASNDPRAIEVAGIRQAAEHAANLTRRLRDFSSQQALPPTVLDVNRVVANARQRLSRVVGERVELICDAAPELWRVKGDGRQLEQVLLNLAANARDAMPAGGRVTITTRNVRVDAALARRRSVAAGEYVELTVADTGVGMDASTVQRVFEPCFTTKERGRGTGLGLASVHGIVQQGGGHITVTSESGSGARFAIYLPITSEPFDAEAVDDPVAGGRRLGSETVLVVQDDVSVRSLIASVLERRGYRLMVAGSGDEARHLSEASADPIHLLITDVVTSGASGIELADAVRSRRPETKVLYVSGSTDGTLFENGLVPPPGLLLNKPFTPDVLARKVRSVLDVQ